MPSYIKLDRKILEWEWYGDINTSRLFIHMLLKANWKDGKFQGQAVPRGSFISSLQILASETDLSVRQVRTAINKLKTTNELTSKSSSKYTLFTIKNYCHYQANDTQNDKPVTSERQTSDKRATTIEEGKKEIKEELNKTIVAPPCGKAATFAEDSFEMLCVNSLVQSCMNNFQGSKVPKGEAEKNEWCIHIDRMKRLDHRSEVDIQEALDFAVKSPFWKTNIRSTKKFREKFETLLLQSRGEANERKPKSNSKNRFHNLEEHGYDYDKMLWESISEGDQNDK